MNLTSRQLIHNENAVYYFKKTYFTEKNKNCVINIFAETRYKLYINGRLIAVGPCRASSEIKYYDELDISEYLMDGENTVEVAVLQLSDTLSGNNYLPLESVIRSGNMCLCIWGDIETDESWLVAKEQGIEFFYKPEYEAYNAIALYEKVSACHKKLKFENAVCTENLYDMEDENSFGTVQANPVKKRTIPMMYFKERDFVGQKNGIFDAGRLTCGYIKLKLTGKGVVKLTYAESMVFKENGRIIKRKRDDENGIIIGDYDIIEIDGECVFEPFWMRTFRYVKAEIDGNVTIEKIDYTETGYPIEIFENYNFGSEIDNKLFEISVNTLKRCMHETYTDCPYYEQLQYTMDTHLQILFTYQLSEDKRLAEKAIDDFAASYRAGGITQSRFPVMTAQYIPGFSLFFILMLYEHFKRFGDSEFTKKYLPAADGIADWFIERLDGYMVPKSNLWDFVDWAEEYDKETGMIPSKEPICVYSLMLSYTLERLSEIHTGLGRSVPEYLHLAESIKRDVKARCFDAKTGLYADSTEKTHFSQHPQIWAVLCDMETGENARKILTKSMELNCKGTLAYMFFLFRAFEKAGMYNVVDECMKDFRKLVELGCTTTPERLGEDVRSECHAWSALAIYEFTAKVLGVTYKDGTIYIEPYIHERNKAKGTVATPAGMVYVEWKIDNNKFTITVKSPKKKMAIITAPDGSVFEADSGEYSCDI
ncbi:MAG TPA: hypothetical protein DCO93_03315 [Clostridiales bacterium]|nr:hypothetical protein [Clostridiales bacterium]